MQRRYRGYESQITDQHFSRGPGQTTFTATDPHGLSQSFRSQQTQQFRSVGGTEGLGSGRHPLEMAAAACEDRIYNFLMERRVIISQFFQQFDPLNCNHVTPSQLSRALALAGKPAFCAGAIVFACECHGFVRLIDHCQASPSSQNNVLVII